MYILVEPTLDPGYEPRIVKLPLLQNGTQTLDVRTQNNEKPQNGRSTKTQIEKEKKKNETLNNA